jgi:hypothetical protein
MVQIRKNGFKQDGQDGQDKREAVVLLLYPAPPVHPVNFSI